MHAQIPVNSNQLIRQWIDIYRISPWTRKAHRIDPRVQKAEHRSTKLYTHIEFVWSQAICITNEETAALLTICPVTKSWTRSYRCSQEWHERNKGHQQGMNLLVAGKLYTECIHSLAFLKRKKSNSTFRYMIPHATKRSKLRKRKKKISSARSHKSLQVSTIYHLTYLKS